MAANNNLKTRANYRLVCFFSFGAIGDYLMTLYMAEQIHRVSPEAKIIIFALKNPELLGEFNKGYPFVQIVKSPTGILITLCRSLYSKTLAIIPESFGKLPVKVFIFARALCLRPGSLAVESSFKKHKHPLANLLCVFDIDKPLYKSMGEMLSTLGYGYPQGKPMFVFEQEKSIFARLGLTESEYIVLHPFAANPKRSLPESRWIEIINLLTEIHPNLRIVVTGSKQDRVVADKLLLGVNGKKPQVVCGDLSIKELATIISKTKLFIGVDTGITHLAATLRAPSVVIASLSNPTWLPVYNEKALILYNKTNCTCNGAKSGNCTTSFEGKEYYRCLFEITNNEIVDAARKLIEN